ncbi:MAG: hypothetical protein ACUVS4_00865 [Chloroflexaceae bacterium]
MTALCRASTDDDRGEVITMDRFELLAALEEGLENGRISPQTAAYIAAELFGIDAYETGYHEWHLLSPPPEETEPALSAD